jgi:apolipoprotein N-acyltransferase
MTDSPAPVHRPRLRAFVLGLLHAGLFSLAFEPVGWWWSVFLAPLPLFALAVRPGRSPVAAGFWAMIGAAPFWAWTHAWIGGISMAGVYPLVVYLSLYTWLFVLIGARAARWASSGGVPVGVSLPVAWVGLEFVRGHIGWNGYPWYLLGHPLIDAPWLSWPASIAGAWVVSLLVAIPAACAVHGLRASRARVWLGLVSLAILACWVLGGLILTNRPPPAEGPVLRVGVVQTNVPQDNRMDWSTRQRMVDWLAMRDLTVLAARSETRPDLIVWPEGLVPGWTLDPDSLDHERSRGILWKLQPRTPEEELALKDYPDAVPATRVVDEMLALQRAIDIPMLVGSVAYDNLQILTGPEGVEYDYDRMFNSAFVVQSGRVQDVWYDKVHLTPFGEVMPYISAWPWLEQQLLAVGAQGMAFSLSPGGEGRSVPLNLADGRSFELATPICFEATMPGVCRRLANRAARSGKPVVLVSITNDGWFGRSDRGRRMHELSARWRCVELGLPMVRCANTGVSGAIDARGLIIGSVPARRAASAVFEVHPGSPGTLYARTGDWLGWACLAALPALVWFGRGRISRELGAADEGTEQSRP